MGDQSDRVEQIDQNPSLNPNNPNPSFNLHFDDELIFPPSHPFYLHPSDNPDIMIVAKQFNGSCFGAWRRGIIIALSAKKKIGFINGSYTRPDVDSPLFIQWEQCNNMPNGAQMYEVQKDLSAVSQGSSDISGYFNKVKRLWDEMESLNTKSYCAVSEIVEDEKQRGIQNLHMFQSDSASFSVGSNLPGPSFHNPKTTLNTQNQKYNFTTPNQYQRGNSDAKRSPEPRKSFCRYCKKSGHVIKTCYKHHGYPQNFKFGNKNVRVAGNVYSNSEVKADDPTENPTSSTITADQYKQLISILQHVQVSDEVRMSSLLPLLILQGPSLKKP
ncbi:PREDICTED: uncharacterized protein LOC109220774 [Nicotiana attenuata]|uniref:uncharacterized protein LOC109220774 n=1 Tax=Nicotiana attenuata TaxID=49451 RepID=UPI0009048CD3|nr:PREDICTED: uncharacterized protein LOC109220774 [Nicotiana attenuata]